MSYCHVSAQCDREASWYDISEAQREDAEDEANALLDRDPQEYDRLADLSGETDEELRFEHVVTVMLNRLYGRGC